ncbi:hypothetical protein B0H16DRAFT_1778752 [Mycena metata]|uniref:Uncharacterized protein n=1 Tax=Mycena metata TaxID=1033252 RepID=A0AAD7NP47_9AGAR|nr:hypothetical protein B0H16DRAFT_1778752 [Mycena metata]
MDSPPRGPPRADGTQLDDNRQSQSPAGSRSSSPLAGRTGCNPLKRPTKNMDQYADSVTNKRHLKPVDGQELRDFGRLTGPQQSIAIFGLMLKNREMLGAITPSEAVHHISTAMEGRIERAAFLVVVDPATPYYVQRGAPVTRVTNYLEKHGLTPDIKNDKSKFPVYTKRSGLRLTHYLIKELVSSPAAWTYCCSRHC